MTVRSNAFSGGRSIYCSARDGSHVLYGDDYHQVWLHNNLLKHYAYGIPVTDEASADSGSRFNDFKYGGSTYWTAAHGAHMI
jgi:LGFP repeat